MVRKQPPSHVSSEGSKTLKEGMVSNGINQNENKNTRAEMMFSVVCAHVAGGVIDHCQANAVGANPSTRASSNKGGGGRQREGLVAGSGLIQG